MIYRAIEKHYGLDDPENDGQGETFAENYLRKIIQLSFHLPETSPEQRFTFVEQMFSVQARKEMLERQKREHKGRDGAEPSQPPPPSPPPPHADGDPFNVNLSAVVSPRIELPRDVKDTGTELETFNSFKDFIRDNPRELKRIVNVHRLVKILLVRKEAPLSEPAQAQLVAWLVFCTRWPVLVDDALRKSAERLGEAPDDDVLGLLSGGSDLGDDAAALQRFRGVLVEQELELPVRDLRTGGLLSEAARISQMVRDRPAPRLSPAVGASSRVGRLDGEPPARADGPSALGPDGADDG